VNARLILRRHAGEMAAVVGMVAIALAVGGYILAHQRLHFPWQPVYHLSAEFSAAQAVTPGQGQAVTVAGVKVGEVSRVSLRGGHAVVQMEIQQHRLPAVYRDARADLRPKTGLQDMVIQLDPGSPSAARLRDGDTLPLASTQVPFTSDELLASLDADTRSYVTALINAGGEGLHGRGADLRAILRAGAPTLARTHRITAALVDRRRLLRSVVSELRLLSDAAVTQRAQLGPLVEATNQTFGALASEDRALAAALDRLPGTLSAARRALSAAQPLAAELPSALGALRPTVRALAPALVKARPLLRHGTPALRQVRALALQARPVLGDLNPALTNLRTITPELTESFRVLRYVTNELVYVPAAPGHSYLYWLAWFAHNGDSILSVEDAHGVAWRGLVLASCSTYALLPQLNPLLAAVTASPACPAGPASTGR